MDLAPNINSKSRTENKYCNTSHKPLYQTTEGVGSPNTLHLMSTLDPRIPMVVLGTDCRNSGGTEKRILKMNMCTLITTSFAKHDVLFSSPKNNIHLIL